MARLPVLALALLALLAAGCGGDDVTPGPSSRDEAAEECLAEARKITEDSARRTAEEACRSIESGDEGKVRDAAEQQCLDAARQIPDAQSRRRAEEQCRTVSE